MKISKAVKIALVISIVLAGSVYLTAEEGKYYVRLRYAEDEVFIQRMTETGIEEAIINTMIMAGDRVWTGEEGRAELIFEDGTVLWINGNTKIDFQAISTPLQSYEESTIISLWAGSVYIRATKINHENFQIDTPACSVFILSEGKYRIDVFADQMVRVNSLRGVAEITTADKTSLLKSGERIYASLEAPPSEPESFNSLDMDDFDHWVYLREEKFASTLGERYVTGDLAYHIAELEQYGSWRLHPSYGSWIWIPRVSVGWRPYYHGYWHWYPCGWSWISYEPWGWAPYHYGYWEWDPFMGWYWLPYHYWSPAWVYWAVGPSYIGWAPVPYRKYNFFRYNNFNPEGWVFVPRTAITARDVRKVKLSPAKIKSINARDVQLYHPLDKDSHLLARQAIPKNSPLIKAKPIKALPGEITGHSIRYRDIPAGYTTTKAKSKLPTGERKTYSTKKTEGKRTYTPTSGKGSKVSTPVKKSKPSSVKPSAGTKSSSTPKTAVPKEKKKTRPPSRSSSSPLDRYHQAVEKARQDAAPTKSYYTSRSSGSYTPYQTITTNSRAVKGRTTSFTSGSASRLLINTSKKNRVTPVVPRSYSSKVTKSLINRSRSISIAKRPSSFKKSSIHSSKGFKSTPSFSRTTRTPKYRSSSHSSVGKTVKKKR